MSITGLTFDYGWRKPMSINFNNKVSQIELVFDAYKGEEVNDKQENSYQLFLSSQSMYEEKAMLLLKLYVEDNQIADPKVEAKSLQFNYDGSFGLLCECSWDIENGIAIVLYPKEEVTRQDNFI